MFHFILAEKMVYAYLIGRKNNNYLLKFIQYF